MNSIALPTHLDDISALKTELRKTIVGQEKLIEKLIVAMLCKGHVLIEGIPGLAKTLTVNTLAKSLGLNFSRIQFTPDLLPSDITGTLIYNPTSGEFSTEKGPIFANMVLADEINRSPAKVQSALLEAMQEKQVTLGKNEVPLPNPFLVLATQNPIEQEGTYQLPEAQLDRFLFKLKVDYPSFDDELEVMRRMATPSPKSATQQMMDTGKLETLSSLVAQVSIAPDLERYIVHLISATREPDTYELEFSDLLVCGASPRASIALALASRAAAVLAGRDYVISDDIRSFAPDVLRHRISLNYKAHAKKITSDSIIETILSVVAVPYA